MPLNGRDSCLETTAHARFLETFDRLDDESIGRLRLYAAKMAMFLEPGESGEELFNEAVLRVIEGRRAWTPQTLEAALFGTIRSIASSKRASQKSRKTREQNYSSIFSHRDPLSVVIELVHRAALVLNHFEEGKDDDAVRMILLLLEGQTREAAAETLGFDTNRRNATIRRIVRHAEALWRTEP
jgi:hypothetical protein